MIELYDKETNDYLGKITEEELQFLINHLEEESLSDVDYYIDRETLESLKSQGMPPELAKIIEDAMGDRQEIEILYKKK